MARARLANPAGIFKRRSKPFHHGLVGFKSNIGVCVHAFGRIGSLETSLPRFSDPFNGLAVPCIMNAHLAQERFAYRYTSTPSG